MARQRRTPALAEHLGRELSTYTVMLHQAVADRLGLHVTDHKCLDLVALHGPMTAGQLAERTGLTTGAITGVLDRLEKRGYIRRERNADDRRQVVVHAEAARCEEVGRLFRPLSEAMARMQSRYTAAEMALVHDFMTRVIEVLRQETQRLRKAEAQERESWPVAGARPTAKG